MPVRQIVFAIRALLLTTPWLLHLLLADLLLSLLLPVSAIFPTFAYNISSRIAESVWRVIQLIFTRINKARISTSGDRIPARESAIVVSNHISWTDFYLIQALAVRAGMLGRCRWFAKQQLKWVPFLGWGLYAMGMPLVTRNWMQDRRELDQVFSKIVQNKWPIYLISFSEATRYTPKKHEETVDWCESHNKRVPRHTLYPRTKGFVATVKELRRSSHVKAVYDCTIAYGKGRNEFQSSPSFWQTVSVPRLSDTWSFHIHVDRHPIEDLPSSDKELAQWLEDRWHEKGDRLEVLKDRWIRSGKFDE